MAIPSKEGVEVYIFCSLFSILFYAEKCKEIEVNEVHPALTVKEVNYDVLSVLSW